MGKLRDYIKHVNGLRFVFENLKLSSSLGRTRLLDQEFMTNNSIIQYQLNQVSDMREFLTQDKNRNCEIYLRRELSKLNDIKSTLNNLSARRNLDDIELFEIKKFAIISQTIHKKLKEYGFKSGLNDLSGPVKILDPENSGIPSFYIYSKYSKRLESARYEKDNNPDNVSGEYLRLECEKIEDEIREELAKKLFAYSYDLKKNLNRLADLDILVAKSKQIGELKLSKPEISKTTNYKGLSNPEIKLAHKKLFGKEFQSVDISFTNKTTLITGANMSGKSVLLKSLALSQYLFQLGFFVPAEKALIKPVDKIMISIGDNQSELDGLSSFATEMLNINNIIGEVRNGKNVLALIDELARTTNPTEGKKIVNGFMKIMNKLKVSCIITTHYDGIITKCRRLRVVGLGNTRHKGMNISNLDSFMDYSLEEIGVSDEVPQEATHIAEILGMDDEFIKIIKDQKIFKYVRLK